MNKRYSFDGKSIMHLSSVQKSAKSELEAKIQKKEYVFEEVSCECGANQESDYEVLTEKDRYGLQVKNVICKKCGLIRITPRMNQNGYNAFYDAEYRKLYSSSEVPTEQFFSEQHQHGLEIYEFIKDEIQDTTNKKVLEIGCGAGGILLAFLEKGFTVKGIDLGSEYINYGRTKNEQLNLEVASAKEIIEKGEQYDVIIVSHVLEHMLNLKEELASIKALLSEQGILYIEVPGIKYIHKVYKGDLLLYMQNAHVYSFSMNTLKQVMGWNAFVCVKADERVRAVFRSRSKEEKEVYNFSEDIIAYLEKLEKTRVLWVAWDAFRNLVFKVAFLKKVILKFRN